MMADGIKLSELALKLGGSLEGSGEKVVDGLAALHEAGGRDVSFLADERYADGLAQTQAGAVVVARGFTGTSEAALVRVDNVEGALDVLLDLFAPASESVPTGIAASAVVSATAQLGEGVAIGPNVVIGEDARIGGGTVVQAGCVIGRGVTIGDQCLLSPNVVVYAHCAVGNRVIIHANTTIGADGFGYRWVGDHHEKIRHVGTVLIEDDVEIGANACIDRAKVGKTVIGRGTKVDNLVQVAHNVHVGEDCILVAQVGIAGSSELGRGVMLGGQCGVSDHVCIGEGAMAGAQCGVHSSLEAGAKVIGTPHRPYRTHLRELKMIQRLPELAQEVKALRKLVNDRGNATNDS